MSEGKYTPGPWATWDMDEFGWHGFATCWGETQQDCRLSIAAVRPGRSHIEHRDNYHEQVANARLIAAAPDMLEALKALIGDPAHDGKLVSGRVKMAADAISKATGAPLNLSGRRG